MRHRLAVALLLPTLLAATACAGQAETRPVQTIETPPPDAPVPVEPDDGVGDGQPGSGPDTRTATKVEPHPGGTVRTRARPWERVVPSEDQTELTVFWSSGVAPCTVLDRVEVEEADDAVTITVYEGASANNPDAVCIEIAEYKAYTVELDEELGARSVLDGAEES